MTESGADRVRRLLERAVRAGVAPGLVAGWQATDEPRPTAVAVGRARTFPNSVAASQDTWFDLASLTKPLVVGTLVLLMARDRIVSMDTTVAEVLPETAATPLGTLTIARLLTHDAGLPAWEPLYALTGGDPALTVSALARLAVGEAGRHVVYSCPGFIVLGIMLERISGIDLSELFTSRVLEPLGIADELGFRPDASRPVAGGARAPEVERRLIEERLLDPSAVPPIVERQPDDGNARFLGGIAGNAGLFGTVTGVLALARAFLVPGALLETDEVALATGNHTPGLEQARGLGWQLAGSHGSSAGPALSTSAFGHTGFTGTSLWVDPTRGIATALLANRVHPGHRETDLHPLRRRFHELVVDAFG